MSIDSSGSTSAPDPAPSSTRPEPDEPGPGEPGPGEPGRDESRAEPDPRGAGHGGAVTLLTPDGVRVPDPTYDPWIADLTDDDLRGLYRDLVLVRRFDAEATALQRQGELGLWASLAGQEAAQVGSGRAMRAGDMAFPTYREHGVAWCRGLDPLTLLALFRGVTGGAWDPADHGFALYSIVVGSQVLHATGYAMGVGKDGGDGAVIAYFGDGASSEGDVNEAFVWAGVFNAPVVFFCENNQWAISEPSRRQSRVPLYRRADGFGFPGVQVDGNDVLATLAVTRRALDDASSGQGPTLVEALTYRMGAHTTADDPRRYRLDDELADWRAKDPISRMRAYLESTGRLDDAFQVALDEEADALAARVRHGCVTMPAPTPGSMFDHVTSDTSVDGPRFAAERATLAREVV
ncbi:MAG: pyruvate dehydrogenase (acetyl-transferring) E1 component subunit alpha [Frankia sp.]